ncbi:Os05g0429751, partial [Oryza sativa Japonica Group]
MVPKVQRHPKLYLARELAFLLVRIVAGAREAVPPRLHRLAEVVMARHCGVEGQHDAAERLVAARPDAVLDGDEQRLVEGLGHDEHELLVPNRVQRAGRRAGARAPHLPGELQLDAEVRGARRVQRHEVLRSDGGDAEVNELGGEVYLGARGGDGPRAGRRMGVGMPGVGEGLVGLGPQPHGEHDLAAGLLATLVLEPVPLGSQRGVRRHTDRHLGEVEPHAADEVVAAGEIFGLDGHLEHVRLEVRRGEGEDLLPRRVVVAAEDRRGALEVAELHLHEGVDGAGGGDSGEVLGLHHVHVEEPHRLDKVVGGRDL